VVAAIVLLSASVLVVALVEIEVVEIADELLQMVVAQATKVPVVDVEIGVEREKRGTRCGIRFDPVAAEAPFGIRGRTEKLHQSIQHHWQPSLNTRNSKPTRQNCCANVESGRRPGTPPRTAYCA